MQQWLVSQPIVSYALIYLFMVYVFNNVFRVRKFPFGKEVIIYLLLAVGAFILFIFQMDKLPIIQCLCIVIVLMLIVRIRYFLTERRRRTQSHREK